MPKVTYEQTLCRSVEVEVTDEELRLMQGNEAGAVDVQQRVTNAAFDLFEQAMSAGHGSGSGGIEWIGSSCSYMNDDGEYEELFDL